ncbi:hypothetical protein AVEN_146636-1 [Araneus ventricosus]|uniref:Uncharacterized protein n=1 Tax=Araneus ventricosus TaxID=182803 RepID=A0A4Y2JG61_ARAVE|nr:hypothetical protein AVEN_146636-1 [Araneus ventricosus]
MNTTRIESRHAVRRLQLLALQIRRSTHDDKTLPPSDEKQEANYHREKESKVSLRNLISAPTRHPRELATSIPAAVSNGTPRSPPC